MELTVLGSSPALPNPGGASSGYVLSEGSTSILIDCGHGVVGVLRSVMDVCELSAIVISHMHPDHYFDLVPLAYAYFFGKLPPIPLYLPPGGQAILDALEGVVGMDTGFLGRIFDIHDYDPGAELSIGGLSVRFALTKHFVPAYAMRFRNGTGKELAYSSDTAYAPSVVDLSRGASVAVFESAVYRYERDAERAGHLDARTAGAMAREAGVGVLVVTHYPSVHAEGVAHDAGEAFGKPIVLAREGEKIRL